MWDSLRNYVRVWDWRLFLFILLFLGLPNELPDPGSLAIVSQWQFFISLLMTVAMTSLRTLVNDS